MLEPPVKLMFMFMDKGRTLERRCQLGSEGCCYELRCVPEFQIPLGNVVVMESPKGQVVKLSPQAELSLWLHLSSLLLIFLHVSSQNKTLSGPQ